MECDIEYLAGVVKGDGTLYYNKRAREYVVEVYDRSIEFVKILYEMLTVCGYNPHIQPYRSYYRLRVNSSALFRLLSEKIEALLRAPSIPFVRGLYDAEGTLYFDRRKKKPYPIVELGNKDYRVIEAVMTVLRSLGVSYRVKTYSGLFYKVVTRGSNAVLLLRALRPLHPVKFPPFFALPRLNPSTPPPKPAH